jgi:transcriptional regulator with XRE-family HTH domain
MKNSTKVTEILNFFREKRIDLGISQHYIADKLDISQSAYHNLESGKTKISVMQLVSLIDILKEELSKKQNSFNSDLVEIDNLSSKIEFLK